MEVTCKEGHDGHGGSDDKGDHGHDCNCPDFHILHDHITLREGGEEMVGNRSTTSRFSLGVRSLSIVDILSS